MGITGLIPFLEKASAKVNLKDLRGSTVAVDSYCWLHKGVFSCAEKIVRGEDTDLYVQYCMKFVQMLMSYDIKVILVFDGQHLPAKALTEQRRRESRQQSQKRAKELLRLGRVEEARSQMRRGVDVTHEMALRLIQRCRERNVDCIVAPYEADAQMAWLNKAGIAEYIITEDSDLTLFGAEKVIFKLDLNGNGLLVEADKFHLAMGCSKERYHFEKFRRMCILSGCDYLDSLPGIGLAKACKFILKTEQDDMRIALKKIPQYLNMRNLEVDDDYIENFMKAEATFKHMYIYNPLEKRMERLHALEDYETDERYCSNAGSLLTDSEKAMQLALGNLNPFTLKTLDNWHPDQATQLATKAASANAIKRSKHKSIWQKETKETLQELKQTSCALYFKKIDFVGQNIQAEIEANQRQEQAKPTEAELINVYSFKGKRKRSPSRSNSQSTPPSSPVQSKSRHNPFAKESLQRPPAVCENASLLRLMSPSKCSPLKSMEQSRVNPPKRCNLTEVLEQVEVRSRFFSARISETERMPRVPKEQLSDEKQLQAQAVERENEQPVVQEKMQPEQPNEQPREANIPELDVESTTTSATTASNEDILLLSSDDDSAPLPRIQAQAKPQLKLAPVARRVGLSKPKAKGRTKSVPISENQTKLSMFGFHKPRLLK
ncbi:PREDICTED: exonuclease 1 [Drosophila arizonae]|uniref:Exonuclease 1 n=1 Tax=Drosophila arizonae TaxID=7263 RepID=A0ABM1NT87_DROAR|nr:PREDICTED: exonuclease 1 [Drosophila arizonae]